MLLYADDTVIFAYSHIDLKRKLKTLEEYYTNKLSVNATKTKIMIFKSADRFKTCGPEFRTYKQDCLQLVNNYVYLGVTLSPSSLGRVASQAAFKKTKCASGATFPILARVTNRTPGILT